MIDKSFFMCIIFNFSSMAEIFQDIFACVKVKGRYANSADRTGNLSNLVKAKRERQHRTHHNWKKK